jgi:3-dehydroquinate synthetase
MGHDKKVQAGKLTFILAAEIGKGVIARDVGGDAVAGLLGDHLG